MKEFRRVVFLFAFFSGLSALIFEIVWAKVFALVFGSTILSVSAVVSSFFAGLAIGSLVFGKASDRSSNVLRLYGLIEIGIGISSLLATLSPSAFSGLFGLIQRAFVERYSLLILSRFLVSFALFLLPSALIGGTFPVLARFFVRSSFAGKDIGSLYATNTAGGMLGTFLAGFVLIGHLGVAEAAVVASSINLFVGVSSLLLSRKKHPAKPRRVALAEKDTRRSPLKLVASQVPVFIPAAMAVSGFCALGYEVLWTRTLSHLTGTTSYTFTIMLFTFLLGTVVGSYLISKFLEGKRNLSTLSTFGVLEILVGIFAFFFTRIVSFFASLVQFHHAESWLGWLYSRFALSSLSLLVPAALLGATFPLAAKLGSRVDEHFGHRLGLIYSLNTLGGVLGSVVTGFVLMQFFGTETSFLILGVMSGLLGVLVLLAEKGGRSSVLRLSFFFLLGLSFVFSILFPSHFFRDTFGAKVTGRLVYFKERSDAAVEVFEEDSPSAPPCKKLYINGTSNTGTNFQARRYMKLQALIPVLIHRNPEDVLVICFGTGMTLGASVVSPDVKSAHCVEISKAVLDAGPIFKEESNDVLGNQKVKVFVEDGRNFVALARRKYDIITLEPSPPTDAGSVNLYTKEFYKACKSSLKERGTVAQWIPFHTQSQEQTRMLISSFISVFPHSLLFMTDRLETLILGSRTPFSIDVSLLRERFKTPSIRNTLQEIGITGPYSLLGCLLMDTFALKSFSQGARELSDNHPCIEYFIPLNPTESIPKSEALVGVMMNLMSSRTDVRGLSRLLSSNSQADEDSLRAARASMEYFIQGEVFRMNGNLDRSIGAYLAALRLDPENEYFRFPLGISNEQAKLLLTLLSRNEKDTFSRIRLGMLYLRRNQPEEAVAELSKAAELEPGNADVHYALAVGLAGLRDKQGTLRELQVSADLGKGNPELLRRINALRMSLR
jgi:spermidine synthase